MTDPELAPGIGSVIRAGRPVADRAEIAALHGLTWRQARRARPWAAEGHPSPITTGEPTHGHPQLWDREQATAFANGQPIPVLPQAEDPADLLDRFAAADAAGVNPVTWASDVYDERVPAPEEQIHGGDWWYRETVERYRQQRAQPPQRAGGRPAGRQEPLPRGEIRSRVAELLSEVNDAGQPISTAAIARRLGIHYTTALRHVQAIKANGPTTIQ